MVDYIGKVISYSPAWSGLDKSVKMAAAQDIPGAKVLYEGLKTGSTRAADREPFRAG